MLRLALSTDAAGFGYNATLIAGILRRTASALHVRCWCRGFRAESFGSGPLRVEFIEASQRVTGKFPSYVVPAAFDRLRVWATTSWRRACGDRGSTWPTPCANGGGDPSPHGRQVGSMDGPLPMPSGWRRSPTSRWAKPALRRWRPCAGRGSASVDLVRFGQWIDVPEWIWRMRRLPPHLVLRGLADGKSKERPRPSRLGYASPAPGLHPNHPRRLAASRRPARGKSSSI